MIDHLSAPSFVPHAADGAGYPRAGGERHRHSQTEQWYALLTAALDGPPGRS